MPVQGGGKCGYLPFALALNGVMRQAGVVWPHLLDALRNAEIGYAERIFKGYAYPPPKHPLF